MEKTKLNYYRIAHPRLIAKGYSYLHWIWRNGSWEKDRKSLVWGKLCGYDASEPEDSPYGFGSTSVMDEIEEISYEEAMDEIGSMIVADLIRKWSLEFKEEKEKWDEKPTWPAKLVETSFCLFGTRYTLKPADLNLKKGPEDDGFMESIQKKLEKDLKAKGATEIESIGFLD